MFMNNEYMIIWYKCIIYGGIWLSFLMTFKYCQSNISSAGNLQLAPVKEPSQKERRFLTRTPLQVPAVSANENIHSYIHRNHERKWSWFKYIENRMKTLVDIMPSHLYMRWQEFLLRYNIDQNYPKTKTHSIAHSFINIRNLNSDGTPTVDYWNSTMPVPQKTSTYTNSLMPCKNRDTT